MSRVTREISAPASAVWDVLSDGWLYPLWVVGASRIRDVDDTWPSRGARLHHSFGVWPAVVDDETECLEVEPMTRMVLQAKGWPMGEARVEVRLEATATGTAVTLVERAVRGPGRLMPNFVEDAVLAVRNRESLQRLAFLAERR